MTCNVYFILKHQKTSYKHRIVRVCNDRPVEIGHYRIKNVTNHTLKNTNGNKSSVLESFYESSVLGEDPKATLRSIQIDQKDCTKPSKRHLYSNLDTKVVQDVRRETYVSSPKWKPTFPSHMCLNSRSERWQREKVYQEER